MPTRTSTYPSIEPSTDTVAVSQPARCPVVYCDFSPPLDLPVPDGYTSIDDVISEHERDAGRHAALQRARQRLAQALYANAPRTLAVLRMERGMSQRELAAKMHTSQAHVARIEAGHDDLRLTTLRKLASALEMSVSEIITATEVTTQST